MKKSTRITKVFLLIWLIGFDMKAKRERLLSNNFRCIVMAMKNVTYMIEDVEKVGKSALH